MRAVALLLTLFCLLTVYFVARSWISARRAVVVVLLVLSGMGFLRRVLGVQQLADLSRSRAPLMLTLTAAMAVVTTLATAQVVAYGAMPGPGRLSASTVPVARRLKSDGPCLLVTGYAPELGWYPGCDTASYAHFRRTPPPPGTRVTLVLFERGRLQPDEASLKRLIGDRASDTRTIPTTGEIGDATVITLR